MLPPVGLSPEKIDKILKKLVQLEKNTIMPTYNTLTATYEIDGKLILVLWAIAGEMRPYKTKVHHIKGVSDWAYYIRKHSSTVVAKGQDEQELLSLANKSLLMTVTMYHRSYEERELIEVRIEQDAITIISYPWADRSIKREDLKNGKAVTRRYRNRRIGEFLKELKLTEGRLTGIPKILRVMCENGSPTPIFETHDEHSYFLIRLPIHAGALKDNKNSVNELSSTDLVNDPVKHLINQLETGEKSIKELKEILGLSHRTHFRNNYLKPALAQRLIEMTIPDKLNSRNQKYRLVNNF